MMAKADKISPLKDRPLHNPGQSLEEQLDELRYEKIFSPLLVLLLLVMLTAIEWVRWYANAQPRPLVYTFVATGYAIYAVWTIQRSRKRLRAIKLGRDGERAV